VEGQRWLSNGVVGWWLLKLIGAEVGEGAVQIGVLVGSFYRAREGGRGVREGWTATVMSTFNGAITRVKEGGGK
jgi:hypothetical protein